MLHTELPDIVSSGYNKSSGPEVGADGLVLVLRRQQGQVDDTPSDAPLRAAWFSKWAEPIAFPRVAHRLSFKLRLLINPPLCNLLYNIGKWRDMNTLRAHREIPRSKQSSN